MIQLGSFFFSHVQLLQGGIVFVMCNCCEELLVMLRLCRAGVLLISVAQRHSLRGIGIRECRFKCVRCRV